MAEPIDVPHDLAGVAVADTEVSDVLGARGLYHFRGRSAPDLGRTSSFEQAAALLLGGADEPLVSNRQLPAEVSPLVDRVDLRTAISLLGVAVAPEPLDTLTADERLAAATRLIGALPTVIASVHHRRPIEPDPALGHIADFLRMIRGSAATAEQVDALRVYAVLTMDHGFANSTFATRVVASSGTDLGACVLAGFGSLTGPRHGSDVEKVLDMYDAIGEPDRAEQWLRDEVAAGRRLRGFGHSVYTTVDPRLALLREHCVQIAPDRHQLAMAVEEAGMRVLAGRRRLAPNLDLHAPVLLEGCGIPRGWFPATFAMARIVGWCAHALEQVEQRKIIRPIARYVGMPPDVETD